jgi:hypothetical protein
MARGSFPDQSPAGVSAGSSGLSDNASERTSQPEAIKKNLGLVSKLGVTQGGGSVATWGLQELAGQSRVDWEPQGEADLLIDLGRHVRSGGFGQVARLTALEVRSLCWVVAVATPWSSPGVLTVSPSGKFRGNATVAGTFIETRVIKPDPKVEFRSSAEPIGQQDYWKG